MARSISTSLHRLLATSTIWAACALLAACANTPTGISSASTSKSSNAALDPAHFGDVMAVGQGETPGAATITLEY